MMLKALTSTLVLVFCLSSAPSFASESLFGAIKDAGRSIGHATRDITREIGHTTRDTTKEIGHAFKNGTSDKKDATKKRNNDTTENKNSAAVFQITSAPFPVICFYDDIAVLSCLILREPFICIHFLIDT